MAQCGAVEEALARTPLTQPSAGAAQHIARTARPKGKGRPIPGLPADGLADFPDGGQPMELRSPSPAGVVEDNAEAEAAQRAVAAAAALRSMKAKKVLPAPPKKLSELGKSGKEVRRVEPQEIESEAEEAPPRQPATLTAANVATLGGRPSLARGSLLDFDMRSVSPISNPGVKAKIKKKRIAKPAVSESPAPRRRKDKARLTGARQRDSPERWAPPSPPVKTKKRSARSEDDGDRVRNRSREKRKGRR